jgi:hypothetical protein
MFLIWQWGKVIANAGAWVKSVGVNAALLE